MSRARDVAGILYNRLTKVLQANGFHTDAGLRVYRGKKMLNVEDLPCIVVIEGPDKVVEQRIRSVNVEQRYIVEGHSQCDPDNPNDTAHDMLEDIKVALFAEDPTMGRNVKNILYQGRLIAPREDGIGVVSCAIEIEVQFLENLDTP